MRVVADSHIPYLDIPQEVELIRCDEITPHEAREADVLLVRTRTRCDASLLQGSKVTFIGTATIGTDHINLDYCQSHGITVCNAPGCNAPAVAQWALSSIGHWMQAHGITSTDELTLGVVGVGHVGSIVARWGEQLGFQVLRNDPPQKERGETGLVSINEVLQECDIITFHTPLTHEGPWPTWHLCNEDFLNRAQRCRLLMNAARGAVCDTATLLQWNGDLAIDCWENEPNISPSLLDKAFIATPHIAGYSLQGKQRGTAMIHDALNAHFRWNIPPMDINTPPQGADTVSMSGIMTSYNPLDDTATLKAAPLSFETLRNHYPLRQEFFE